MPRLSRTGVRGLTLNNGRYIFELRWRNSTTGKLERFREVLPEGITPVAAKKRALQLNASLVSGTWSRAKDGPARHLDELLQKYLTWAEVNRPRTWKTKKSLASVLREHLGNPPLEEIAALLENYKARRSRKGTAPGTINRSLIMLRHMMRLALDWDWTTQEQATKVRRVALMKEPPGRVRYLSDDERSKLLGALPERVRPIVLAALLSGMRRGELLGLKKSAVDLEQRTITLTQTKSNRVRRVPINDALAAVLEVAMSDSTKEHVFVSNRQQPYSPWSVSRAFNRAVKKLALKDLRFHDTRHDFATRVRRAGHDIDTIRELLGHSTIAMAARYAHVSKRQLHDAVAVLSGPRDNAEARTK